MDEWDVLHSASGEGTHLSPGVELRGADEALSFSLSTERMTLKKRDIGIAEIFLIVNESEPWQRSAHPGAQ